MGGDAARAGRASIDALLRRYGLRVRAATLVSTLDCEIHRLATDGGELALRIYAEDRTDRGALETEIAWLGALADAGLRVPRPVADREGRVLQCWQPDAARPARDAVLLGWVEGRLLDRGLRPLHLRRVGVLTAALHHVAERLRADGRATTQRPADWPDLAGWAEGRRPRSGRVPAALAPRLRAVAARLRHDLADLPGDTGSAGLIHGDLHLWNLLFAGGEAGAIDFSDCGLGPHALDLAATLQYLRYPWVGNHDPGERYAAMREALFEGYAAHRALPARWEHQVEVCTARPGCSTRWSGWWTCGRGRTCGRGDRTSCAARRRSSTTTCADQRPKPMSQSRRCSGEDRVGTMDGSREGAPRRGWRWPAKRLMARMSDSLEHP